VLDGFGRLEEEVQALRARHAAWRAAAEKRAAAEAELEQARREEEFLRHAHDELAALDPQPGEEPDLAERRQLLRHGEALVEAINEAAGELARGDGVDTALRLAMRHLERNAEKAGGLFETALAALDRAAVELTEAQAQIEALTGKVELDPRELEKVEERLFALRGLARKHDVEPDALAELREDFARQLARIEDSGGELAALAAAEEKAEAAYRKAAAKLGEARRKAAGELDAAVMAELAPLKLEKARFVTEIVPLDPEEWGPTGGERVQFTVATNPGARPGPLNRIASGGELSRFMLALKVATSRDSRVPTLVFDEVDSGVGGATAAAVGERLARLARDVQVLVVTHSPQVAALGAAQWRIAKASAKSATVTRVERLDEAGRIEEVARMLAGADVTEEARAAAKRLMAGSAAP
jgi:DNA repair protein RecN (Recombination protein N)